MLLEQGSSMLEADRVLVVFVHRLLIIYSINALFMFDGPLRALSSDGCWIQEEQALKAVPEKIEV